MKNRGISNYVNIIIVSDHGMSETPTSKAIRVSDILGMDIVNQRTVRNYNVGPIFDLYFSNKSQITDVYNQLTSVVSGNQIFSTAIQGIYTRENMPQRFHYASTDRIGDIIIVGNVGYSVLRTNTSTVYGNGNHGYDNESVEMQSFFLASGKKFKTAFQSSIFNNLDVYPLVCKLLNINPSPNNGTLTTVSQFLN